VQKLLIALTMSALAINSYAANTSFNTETSVVHIPIVEINGSPVLSNVNLKLRSDGLLELISAQEYTSGDQNGDYIISQINGEFTGWDGNTTFELINGQVWQQVHYSYVYHYAFMPRVRITYNNGTYQMEVEYLNASVEVVRLK